MNNIEILKDLEKYISFANKQCNFSNDADYKWHKELAGMIENLIQENKELKEYQYKVNEIMNFDEENLDTIRVANNYIGLKNCVTQLRKQIEKLEGSQCVYKDTSSCNKVLSFETYTKLKDYIPKSKVKEKIEYYQDLYKQDNSPNDFLIGQDCLSKLSILQELLEE